MRRGRFAHVGTIDATGEDSGLASGIRFAVLGPVRAWRDGSEINLGGPQQRAILATLLLQAGTPMSIDELVDALWAEDPPASAVAVIRTYVHRLRRTLAVDQHELIKSVGSGYLLQAPAEAVDLTLFRRLLAQARQARDTGDLLSAADSLHDGLALWTGTPLADVPGQYAETQRAALIELRLSTVEDCLDHEIHLGRYVEAAAELSLLSAQYPLRERLREMLMLALYGAGRQADALAVYHDARRKLADELGIEPGPGLQAVHTRILNGDPELVASTAQPEPEPAAPNRGYPPALVVPAQLPRDLPLFTGRRTELAHLLGEYSADDPMSAAVTVISGMAGVGKTALAVRLAHLIAEQFPDGQLYLDLRGFDHSDAVVNPGTAIRRFLDALGVPSAHVPAEVEAQVNLYRSLLAGRRMLVVLDNARDAEQVRPLLPGASGCRTLVTSRNQLRALFATEGASALTLSPLSPVDARDALVRRVGAARVNADPAAADEIITLCAGLPRALAIVAADLAGRPSHPLSAVATELREANGSLDAFANADPTIDARAAFSLSYRTLGERAAALFRLTALHPGPELTPGAAASLLGEPVAAVLPVLDELERVHLVNQDAPQRYSLHDLVRVYATELALADPLADRRAAQQRMLDHYLHSANAAGLANRHRYQAMLPVAGPDVSTERFADHAAAQAWLTGNYPALHALIGYTVQHGLHEYTWQLAWVLDPFHDRQGRWQDKVVVQRSALASAWLLDDRWKQAYSHRSLGYGYEHFAERELAREHYTVAMRLYVELDDIVGQAITHQNFGAIEHGLESHEQALVHYGKSLQLSRSVGDRYLEAAALNNLGWTYSFLGDQVSAIEHCERALAYWQQADDRGHEADTLHSLGQCYHRTGDHQQAISHFTRALSTYRDLQDRHHEADTLRRLAVVQRAAGDLAAATVTWQQALVASANAATRYAAIPTTPLDSSQVLTARRSV
jgi:DNA-binding SARP family transcriptional activator/tetratricopeptide (TPR) repeat protein